VTLGQQEPDGMAGVMSGDGEGESPPPLDMDAFVAFFADEAQCAQHGDAQCTERAFCNPATSMCSLIDKSVQVDHGESFTFSVQVSNYTTGTGIACTIDGSTNSCGCATLAARAC